MKRILYLLTEERPKVHILYEIIKLEYNVIKHDLAKIVPIHYSNHKFSFIYHATGIEVEGFDAVLIKVVSGESSFVDYLVFDGTDTMKDTIDQSKMADYVYDLSDYFGEEWRVTFPTLTDIPKYVVEETKTDDNESRNTNAYQRSSKFVFSEYYYGQEVNKYMLYDYSDGRKLKKNDTHVFGMRMLVTNGVKLVGLPDKYLPFTDLNEFINEKNRIANNGRSTNIPLKLRLDKANNKLFFSAKLDKGKGKYKNKITNDPNIGAVAIISSTLRKLGWGGKIVIERHNLLQNNISNGNKLLYIMKKLDVTFDDINIDWSLVINNKNYFKYNTTSEKIVSIYYHLYIKENHQNKYIIFNNHAGCGKSYFKTPQGNIPVTKDTKLPDLIVYDSLENKVKVLEAETSKNAAKGVKQLSTFKDFIINYINVHYPDAEVECSVITWGKSLNPYVSFYLDTDGSTVFIDDMEMQYL